MNLVKFSLAAAGVGLIIVLFAHWLKVDYFYFAGYTILQYIVLSTDRRFAKGLTRSAGERWAST